VRRYVDGRRLKYPPVPQAAARGLQADWEKSFVLAANRWIAFIRWSEPVERFVQRRMSQSAFAIRSDPAADTDSDLFSRLVYPGLASIDGVPAMA
jgi:hypothetical protein